MKTATLAGLALLVLGVLALAYQGITYTTHKKVVDIGPFQATKEENKRFPCHRFWEESRWSAAWRC